MATSTSRLTVLSLYRQLLRARLVTFNNDQRAIIASRIEINKQFQFNKLLTDTVTIESSIINAREALDYLIKSVIQTRKSNNSNNYTMKIDSQHIVPDPFAQR